NLVVLSMTDKTVCRHSSAILKRITRFKTIWLFLYSFPNVLVLFTRDNTDYITSKINRQLPFLEKT
ncbi:MAG: hypothetical protein NTX05_00735, partial [Fusobacteria bacterium]|nr:hypothetical protein [Fusobacteriota bacterium]